MLLQAIVSIATISRPLALVGQVHYIYLHVRLAHKINHDDVSLHFIP
jgi:hypothetical protein